jgi:hypothetical protein
MLVAGCCPCAADPCSCCYCCCWCCPFLLLLLLLLLGTVLHAPWSARCADSPPMSLLLLQVALCVCLIDASHPGPLFLPRPLTQRTCSCHCVCGLLLRLTAKCITHSLPQPPPPVFTAEPAAAAGGKEQHPFIA